MGKQKVFEEGQRIPEGSWPHKEMYILRARNIKSQQTREFEFWSNGKSAHNRVFAYFKKHYNQKNEWEVISVSYA